MCDCERVVELLTEIRDLLAPAPSSGDGDQIEVRGD